MNSNTEHIVVVGGGQAGAQVLESLRAYGYQGELTLVSEEPELPYLRPPLSKGFLVGKNNTEWLLYRPRSFYENHQINTILKKRVTEIILKQNKLLLDDGTSLYFDKLALTTGSRARRLPLPVTGNEGIYYLRTLEDVKKIRAQAAIARRVAIIGGGFIGLEVAATLNQSDTEITILEAQEQILARVAAPVVSDFFLKEHQQHGISVHTGVAIKSIDGGNGEPLRIDCESIGVIEADLVLIGIGILPNVELAERAGLECDNGIVVNECALTSHKNVVAAGDCTSQTQSDGKRVRLETVHNAVEQAKSAAATLCDVMNPYQQVPWVWSDQYEFRLQSVGQTTDYTELVIRGNPTTGKFGVFYFQNQIFTGMNAINRPMDFAACRKILNRGIALSSKQARDPTFDLNGLLPKQSVLRFDTPWPPLDERRKSRLSKLPGRKIENKTVNGVD